LRSMSTCTNRGKTGQKSLHQPAFSLTRTPAGARMWGTEPGLFDGSQQQTHVWQRCTTSLTAGPLQLTQRSQSSRRGKRLRDPVCMPGSQFLERRGPPLESADPHDQTAAVANNNHCAQFVHATWRGRREGWLRCHSPRAARHTPHAARRMPHAHRQLTPAASIPTTSTRPHR